MSIFSRDNNPATYLIRSFKKGQIQINDIIYKNSIIVSAHCVIENWAPHRVTDITQQHLAQAATLKPKILIIGTGVEQHFIALDLYGDLLNQGIGVEIMSTPAACRTYHALTAEGREVVAALLLE